MWKRLPKNGKGFGPGSGNPRLGFGRRKRTRPNIPAATTRAVRKEGSCDILSNEVIEDDASVHAQKDAIYITVTSIGRQENTFYSATIELVVQPAQYPVDIGARPHCTIFPIEAEHTHGPALVRPSCEPGALVPLMKI